MNWKILKGKPRETEKTASRSQAKFCIQAVWGQHQESMLLFLSVFCYSLRFASGSHGMSEEVSFSPSNQAIKIHNQAKGRLNQT